MRPSLAFVAALVLSPLAGCDRLGLGPADPAAANGAATAAANGSATAPARPQPSADAGLARSRSLAGLIGGGDGAAGGKDPAAIPAAAPALRAELLAGSWSDDGSCKQVVELRPDGTLAAADGVVGDWSLRGDWLILSGPGETVRLRLRSVDAEQLVVENEDGSVARSTRC